MEYEQIKDALSGLSAYDGGCVDSGIRDNALKARVIGHIQALDADTRRRILGRITRELYLDSDSLELGYGPEDARDFLGWLDDNGVLV